jgi:murein tripeptide amidase MpaA
MQAFTRMIYCSRFFFRFKISNLYLNRREWISPAAVTYVIDSIVTNWDSESQDIRSIDWYILPVMNPDGYEFTFRGDRLWRKNRRRHTLCSGVDLNRNYGHRWGGQGSSKQPCSETFAGSRAFSEPETNAVQRFLKESAANFKASLSFHSYGQYM